MRYLLIGFVILLALTAHACSTYKIYTKNTLKTVQMPDDYNKDHKECVDYTNALIFSKGPFSTNYKGKKPVQIYEECMVNKGWRE